MRCSYSLIYELFVLERVRRLTKSSMALMWIQVAQVLYNTDCEVLILQHVIFSIKAYFGVYLTQKELKYISCL